VWFGLGKNRPQETLEHEYWYICTAVDHTRALDGLSVELSSFFIRPIEPTKSDLLAYQQHAGHLGLGKLREKLERF
jgi:hypothetical protein